MARRYASIWDRLKNKEICKIKVDPRLMERTIKAVSKLKHEDELFKQANPDFFFLDIQRNPEEGIVIFQLKSSNNLQPIKTIEQALGLGLGGTN